MKQKLVAWLCLAALCCAWLCGCQSNQENSDAAPGAAAAERENDYHEDIYFHQKHFWIPYGEVVENVQYYSRTAGANKHFNILLPPHYKQSKRYPVLYVLHGFYGEPEDHLHRYSYLQVLYGNLLHKKMAQEMLIVSVDMYTDKPELKAGKTQEQMRLSYDKVIEDIRLDVMPFVEQHYPVKSGRENTAVAGVSEGGAEALCIGIKWADSFGYIGAFAPNPGVVPTPYYHGTYWENTVFEAFPKLKESEKPCYLYMTVGSKDTTSYLVTKAYEKALDESGIPNQTDYVKGFEHGMEFWKACFYNFLRKVF
ncbi:MAG: hypothetical protein IJJ41_00535 [Clostridia bacterium]|nr:hypothetical protein [Clostridia bacterium]